MLSILLSHWAIYMYIAYVLVLVVLCIVYRPRVGTFYKKVQQFRPRVRQTPSRMGIRQLR